MTEWITDRLPTERDADGDGDVRVPRDLGADPLTLYGYQFYKWIVPGQPWWSRNAATAPEPAPESAPEPAPEPAPVAGRKIVQFVHVPENDYHGQKAFALCDDGTMWTSSISNTMCAPWQQLPPIPQREPQS